MTVETTSTMVTTPVAAMMTRNRVSRLAFLSNGLITPRLFCVHQTTAGAICAAPYGCSCPLTVVGITTLNRAPFPLLDSTEIDPPWRSTISLQMARLRPCPSQWCAMSGEMSPAKR